MKASVLLKYAALFVLLLSLGAGIWLRYNPGMRLTCAHQDSIAVASSIIRSKSMNESYLDRKLVMEPDDSASTQKLKGYLIPLKKSWEGFFPFFKRCYILFSVPWDTSFAPLQYVATSFLISPNQDLPEILFWGRFPSLLADLASMILMILILRKLYSDCYLEISAIAVSVLAFSWMMLIHSQSMMNYSLGVLISFGIIYWIVSIPFKINPRACLLSGFLVGILCAGHYQILIFVPALFAAYFIKGPSFKKVLPGMIVWCIPVLFSFATLFFLFLNHKLGRSTSYGVGDNNEFLFQWGGIHYFFTFFLKNSFLIFDSFFQFYGDPNPVNRWLVRGLVLVFIVGIFQFFWSKTTPRSLKIYVLISLMTYFVLVVMQRLSYGPSRHNFILLPFVLVLLCSGFHGIFTRYRALKILALILPVFIGTLFLKGYPIQALNREELYLTKRDLILQTLEKYHVNYVFDFENNQKLIHMKDVLQRYPVYNYWEDWFNLTGRQGWFGTFSEKGRQDSIRRYAFIGSREVEPRDFTDMLGGLEKIGRIEGTPNTKLHQIHHEAFPKPGVDLEISELFYIGRNGLYIYIFEDIK